MYSVFNYVSLWLKAFEVGFGMDLGPRPFTHDRFSGIVLFKYLEGRQVKIVGLSFKLLKCN